MTDFMMTDFDPLKPPWTGKDKWESWRERKLVNLGPEDKERMRAALDDAAVIGTCAAAECIEHATSSFSLGVAAQRLLGLREPDPMWREFEALFQWRDACTDRYGDELIDLLAAMGDRGGRHPQLPPELVSSWDRFASLSEDLKLEYAEAFVHETNR